MERMTSQQSKPGAVIDVGTHSVLLVVGRLDGEGQLEFLRQETEPALSTVTPCAPTDVCVG